jgi:uncharacterized protein YkwD
MKKALVGIILAVLVVFVAAPVASARNLTPNEKALLALVNKERARHNLPALRVNAKLETASRAHSREMIAKDYFSHSSASGEVFSKRLIRFGYTQNNCTYWCVGENIAKGVEIGATPQAIFLAWMASPTHKAIILTKKFRDCGIGQATGDFNGTAGTTVFTLDVGKRQY